MEKENKKELKIKRIFSVLGFIILLWLSFGAGIYLSGKNEMVKKLAEKENVFLGNVFGKYTEVKEGMFIKDVEFDLFWEVWDTLTEQYVDKDKISEKKLFYGALKGMVAAVGDPYTVFMDPKISKDFSDDLKGTFEGIGAEIGIKNDILTIVAPLPEMPAEIAGLRSGDKVLAIDGESTMGIMIDEAVNKIRGPKNTDVTLSIVREGVDELLDIVITRGKIIVKSVRTEIKENDVFVVKITNFNEDTEALFNKAVREIVEKNPKGIILDLRSNPGGFLDTAIEVSSEWVENNIVVSEKHGSDFLNEHLSRGRARLKDFQTVVLVNEGSASASEIVSGALQDYGLATIIGRKTFGKGSVQTLNKFDDGSSVKITIAKWLTPNGRSINDDGILPDYDVKLSSDDYNANKDPQMEAAIEFLHTGSISKDLITPLATSTDELIN